jgi:Amt family ammonium transporter
MNAKPPLRKRFRDRQVRKRFVTILGGKMLGIVSLLALFKAGGLLLGGVAGASTFAEPVVHAADIVNPINTLWVLVAAFLVFFMQAGFMALEAGVSRSRETVNILMECVFDTCLCGILYWAFGFALQFGAGNGFVGHSNFFLQGTPTTYGTTGVAFLAFFLFQFAFADTASTITSGAMVGRTGFKGDIMYSVMVSGLLYPIFGHWVWGGGWLGGSIPNWMSNLTGGTAFHDFAGSTVVHTVGGVIALMGAIVLGPRLGRTFTRDGGGPTPPHDLTIAALGAVILWFGWYGFNPGSTLSAMDFTGMGRVAANTTLAACAGGLIAVLIVYPRSKKWDLGMSCNGFLGGLVAITCPCYWVSPTGSVIIGALAAVIVVYGVDLIEWLRIDDPIGAVAVHMFCGIFGTLSLGLFATGTYGLPTTTGQDTSAGSLVTGLFYGGGAHVLVAQCIGSAACVVLVGGAAFAIFKAIDALGLLRVEESGELEGIDISEHGLPAYHVEFGQGMTYTAPAGSRLGGSIPSTVTLPPRAERPDSPSKPDSQSKTGAS